MEQRKKPAKKIQPKQAGTCRTTINRIQVAATLNKGTFFITIHRLEELLWTFTKWSSIPFHEGMDPAPLVQLVPLWGWVPPRSHRHSLTINIHRPSVTYESSWFTLVSLELYYFSFFSIFSEFSETPKLQLFPSPERQMLARTLWRSRPAFCSKEFLLHKIRISAAQLPRQPIHGFTNTFIFSGYKGYMISSVPLWKPPRERNATTTLPPENLAKTSPPFVGFLPHLSFRNLSSLTKDSCSGLGLEHQKYWQVFPWKKTVCLS